MIQGLQRPRSSFGGPAIMGSEVARAPEIAADNNFSDQLTLFEEQNKFISELGESFSQGSEAELLSMQKRSIHRNDLESLVHSEKKRPGEDPGCIEHRRKYWQSTIADPRRTRSKTFHFSAQNGVRTGRKIFFNTI